MTSLFWVVGGWKKGVGAFSIKIKIQPRLLGVGFPGFFFFFRFISREMDRFDRSVVYSSRTMFPGGGPPFETSPLSFFPAFHCDAERRSGSPVSSTR